MACFVTMVQKVGLAIVAALLLAVTTPGSGHAADFSDGQLKSFAMAWTNITQLAEQWRPQVEAAASQDEANKMLEQLAAEVDQVIEQTQGIGAAEYESIMQAAQSDPELMDRICAMLQSVQPQ